MSNIEWTDVTWNPVRGCSRVSQGCVNCYAERQAIRHAGPGGPYEGLVKTVNGHPTWTGQVRLVPNKLAEPLHWRKPRRVFVNSMSDLFHEGVSDQYIDRVFAVMALCPQHTFQVLTKRPGRMREYLTASAIDGDVWWAAMAIAQSSVCPESDPSWPLPNVWLGVSVEDQRTADERIPLLLDTPAAVRFVSYEPALGPVLFPWWVTCPRCQGTASVLVAGGGIPCPDCLRDGSQGEVSGIDWLIVGGESGAGARPCDVTWIRSAVEQCRSAGVPVFVKQIGADPRVLGNDLRPARVSSRSDADTDRFPMRLRNRKGADPAEWPADLRVRQWPSTTHGRTPT